MNYQEQRKLDAELAVLQRECSESRWALSDPKLYLEEIARLTAQKAELAVLMSEDE